MAGKRNGQAVAAILNNFEAVEDSLNSMEKSAGSADKEMSVVMDSMDYKLNRLKETGTGVFQNLFHREDMKSIIDGFTSILNVVDTLTSKLGLIGTAFAGISITAFVKNFA